ncbi:unnamed protein product [Arctia plantaginis]|uniref:Uncharacterized protein n=1 Tax=Arctia plantaginis TaxID=874455 RepID=A0A8S0YLT6_ARCPL|nr:unnamed protein product [Arctia plantaginis]
MCKLHVIYIAFVITSIYPEIAFAVNDEPELSTTPSGVKKNNNPEDIKAAPIEGNLKLSKTKSKTQKKTVDAKKFKTIKLTILKGDHDIKPYSSTPRLITRRDFKKYGYVPISEDLLAKTKFLPNHHIVRKNLDNSGLPLLEDKFKSLQMLL